METHYFSWENPLEMVIFYSYVKLPEGTWDDDPHRLWRIFVRGVVG